MAEKHSENGQDGCGSAAVADTQNEVNPVKRSLKRCSSTSPGTAPACKSPRSDSLSSTTQTPETGDAHSETDKQEMQTESAEGPLSPSVCPNARRKSWRRATITRRSLPILPNQYQVLCRSISTSLSQQERFKELLEASMTLAIERTQNSLQSVPNTSLQSFQKQVEHMKAWSCLAKNIDNEPKGHHLPASADSDPFGLSGKEKIQKAINRLQAESESWKALLNKHQSKAEELKRKVEQGQEKGVSLDSTSLAQSSQYLFIQSKPDYHSLLCRQQPMLHTVAVTMDTQCKMVRELLSVMEQSQLFVKETSGQLATEAGFQDFSPDLIRNHIATLAGGVRKQSTL
uniref:DSN1 component of MIS12 kinetochore complex n=1 Tax=Monopterus albus TaxID=43700 RepID=A0A3Q3IRN2_MONAL|nr:uncharacterized protein LOC109965903 [Monopterus albus]